MSLYFITGNINKFHEIQAIVPEVQIKELDLPEIQHIDPMEVIKAKLRAASEQLDEAVIVEDTSFSIDVLNGLPGPFIKWFEKTIGNDGICSMAEKLGSESAVARTLIGYYSKESGEHIFEGTVEGKIVSARGDMDFGWAPIFEVAGTSKTFAEMERSEKNKISMRAQAAIKLKQFLDTL